MQEDSPRNKTYSFQPAPSRYDISGDAIGEMVDRFYADVRSDPLLGPIFEARVGGDWDAHLDKMRRFWTTVLLGQPGYRGNPMEVHRRIGGLTPELFHRWLVLFQQTATACLPEEVAGLVANKATRMARALSTAALGAPCV